MWATRMRGQNPTDGSEIDEESCAVVWLPMLLTESVKASNQTGAAVESFRNEMVKSNAQALKIAAKNLLDAGDNLWTES